MKIPRQIRIGYLTLNFDWAWWKMVGGIGIFRNRPGIIPGRWGWYCWGIEFGSRDPGDRVGVFLKWCGLWPW